MIGVRRVGSLLILCLVALAVSSGNSAALVQDPKDKPPQEKKVKRLSEEAKRAGSQWAEGEYLVYLEDIPETEDLEAVIRQFGAQYGGKFQVLDAGGKEKIGRTLYWKEAKESDADALVKHPWVKDVTQNITMPAGWEKEGKPAADDSERRQAGEPALEEIIATQSNPPPQLDRIDQRGADLNGKFSYLANGSGTRIYVVDTGVRKTHNQFISGGSSRVTQSVNCIGGTCSAQPGNTTCIDHGTMVASLAAGKTLGVARGASIVDVKISHCNVAPYLSDIAAGLAWVRDNAVLPAVVNLSLAYSVAIYPAADIANMELRVSQIINNGPTVVAAAGNGGASATDISPARLSLTTPLVTVGATVMTTVNNVKVDVRDALSGGGPAVKISAPSNCATWATHVSDTDQVTCGTSLTSGATALVSGAAATYVQHQTSLGGPTQVRDALETVSTANRILQLLEGTPNRLLFTNFASMIPTNAASYAQRIAPDSLVAVFTDSLDTSSLRHSNVYFDAKNIYTRRLSDPTAPMLRTPSQFNILASAEQPWLPIENERLIQMLVWDARFGSGCNTINDCASVGVGNVYINAVSPGVFTNDATGSGNASAQLYYPPPANPSAPGQCPPGVAQYGANCVENTPTQQVSVPLTPASNQFVVVIYGTGMRHYNSPGGGGRSVTLGGVQLSIDALIPSPCCPGLDQINARLPENFALRGNLPLVVTIGNYTANATTVFIK